MRSLALLLALVSATPIAAAQELTPTTFEVEPFDTPIPPLGAPVSRNYTVHLFCDPPAPLQAPRKLTLAVDEAPAWSTFTFDPAEHDLMTCQGEQVFTGLLVGTANADAPANVPSEVAYSAHVDPGAVPTRDASASGTLPFTVGTRSLLDVQIPDAIAVMKPGEVRGFPVSINNLGNSEVRVTLEVDEIDGGVTVELPEPIVLQSKQLGGARTREEVVVSVRAPKAAGYMNEGSAVVVRVSSVTLPEGAPGDDSNLSLLITTRGLDTPAPSLPLLLLAALVVTFTRRRALRR